jgi:DNA-binding response OmpR family regulator
MSGGPLDPDLDYAVLALSMGAQAVLKKPFTRPVLVATIQAVVEKAGGQHQPSQHPATGAKLAGRPHAFDDGI